MYIYRKGEILILEREIICVKRESAIDTLEREKVCDWIYIQRKGDLDINSGRTIADFKLDFLRLWC